MMTIWPEGGGIPANEEELHGQQQEGLRDALRGREELLPRALDLRRRVLVVDPVLCTLILAGDDLNK